MAIEAPISKFKKNGLLLYISALVLAGTVFAYDGYLSKYKWSRRYNFYKKHVIDNDGVPTSTMNFNRKSPVFFFGFAVVLAGYFLVVRSKKLVADENELVISSGEKIPYDSITKIDKTYFDSKGFFVLTYRDGNDKEVKRKISNRRYDNLDAVLDHLVGKMR